MHLNSIKNRLSNRIISKVEIVQRDCFCEWVKQLPLSSKSVALSVSTGDGIWDYFTFLNNKAVHRIVATDIVENPVKPEDKKLLKTCGEWEFVKVKPDAPLPFPVESFDLIFHQDVVEHVSKPFLFLSEQYRVLKKNGVLIVGTPNLFRPVNVIKLLFGRLGFPVKIGFNHELGDYIHIQEFYEQQMRILIGEVGFRNIEIKHCFFGVHPLNITFAKYPKNSIGQKLCHFLMFKCLK
ncbi:MAG: class I SAM-dependent methyltransferase [Elusimicrobiales bacterium]|jgi:ubiquinone/menaquinone biosynthesis C-methylase UbiE